MSNLPGIINQNSMTSNSMCDLLSIQRRRKEKCAAFARRRLPMVSRRVLTSIVAALAATITMQSFAQDRGTGATAAAGAKAETIQGTFMTSDAIPWKPADPRKPDGVQMFVVWGNPKEGPSGILLKFPAGADAGWHTHTAAYQGIVIQGKATHTVKGAAPQTGGPGSVWSQPAGQVHDDKCEAGGDCIEFADFDGKLDFIPVDSSYRYQ
jgi:quercetin dioxygenase-like cupin family protein